MDLQKMGKEKARKILSNATYLENDLVVTKRNEFRIFGCPWSPNGKSSNKGWQFPTKERERDFLGPLANLDSVDIVMSHAGGYKNKYEFDLILQRLKPRLNVSGHYHEEFGAKFQDSTTFVNCAILNKWYWPLHPVSVIDLLNPDVE